MINFSARAIKFGKGDVSIALSIIGTPDKPQPLLVLTNQKPQPIRTDFKLTEDSEYTVGKIDPMKRLLISFSNPESIDAAISVLEAAKSLAFGEFADKGKMALEKVKPGSLSEVLDE